jgi:hypothetical protein
MFFPISIEMIGVAIGIGIEIRIGVEIEIGIESEFTPSLGTERIEKFVSRSSGGSDFAGDPDSDPDFDRGIFSVRMKGRG